MCVYTLYVQSIHECMSVYAHTYACTCAHTHTYVLDTNVYFQFKIFSLLGKFSGKTYYDKINSRYSLFRHHIMQITPLTLEWIPDQAWQNEN